MYNAMSTKATPCCEEEHMVTVTFSIPEMVNIPKGSPTLYLWLEYFWADILSLGKSPPQLGGTYMVPFPYPRSITQRNSSKIDLSGWGNFSTTLDDAGMGEAFAGVAILLLEKHDTNDTAIQMAQTAVDSAFFNQINAYLQDNFGELISGNGPTSEQINAIITAVSNAAEAAVKRYSPIWEWINPDSHVGTSYLFFQAENGTGGAIPNISGDKDHQQYNQCSFPLGSVLVATKSGVDPCASQVATLREQLTSMKNLTNQLHALERELASVHAHQEGQIRAKIAEVTTQRAQVQGGLGAALNGLQGCRLVNR